MNEFKKALSNLEEGTSVAVLYIDEENNVLRIDGSEDMRTACYEVSRYIIDRTKEIKKPTGVRQKPPNTKVYLPPLPPSGIDGLTFSSLETYWNVVVRSLLPEKGRHLGYETLK